MSAEQSGLDNRLRRFAVAIGAIILAAVIFASAVVWWTWTDATDPAFKRATIVAAEHACEPVTAASWSIGGGSGETWVVTTNLASCDEVRRRLSGLVGKSLLEISHETDLRCTANAIIDGKVVSGICYVVNFSVGFFAWGADVPPYDHPAPCGVCTGVPGENVGSATARS